MDILDRYLQAVRFWLPRAQQDDIIAELSEDMHSEIEEQESKLGRTLNESEMAAILKKRGRPLLVANRYRPQQYLYLVGPALFPAYRFVLIIVALCYLLPWVLTWFGLAILDPYYHADFGRAFGPLWGTFWVNAFVVLGAVTLVFAILERANSKLNFLENWDPLKLPPLRDPNRISRVNSTIDLAANLVFAVWWVTYMWSTTIFDRGGVRIEFVSAWEYFLWVFFFIAAANIALAWANLARPYWTWLRASLQLVLMVAASVAFCWLFKSNILSHIVIPNLPAARASEIVTVINTDMSKSFPFALFACVLIVALSGVGRLVRMRTSRKGRAHVVAVR
jgi:hypothetical protein